eukprot:CAMPEP_0183314138 /NCGR_PEP_ID=MMETSP0160_2-20130417/47541_1 /TAXON_ID=2839 ORGANISM="Odontella Sinensis, Strain Grunow 1884" /NCGR_SAMPLE_ID=MMETSP0160_2 /ASSEMBLY_ACC=CAM_ASM_000250 /LENGTH=62 /DNA_ID=CAMNT_0025479383 /DNA_START=24 /DNA_END=209 /DNA_ORIENTATION=+
MSDAHRAHHIAAACDVTLSAVCLVMLFLAEANREGCCHNPNTSKDECYSFGSRLCGGLGKIE